MKKTTTKRLSILIPAALHARLEREAKREHSSVAELSRKILRSYLTPGDEIARAGHPDIDAPARITKAISEGSKNLRTGRYEE